MSSLRYASLDYSATVRGFPDMNRWVVVLNVWPHSTGAGQETDQEACGPREQSCEVQANTISEAAKFGELFQRGICINPRVWQAPIMSIARITA